MNRVILYKFSLYILTAMLASIVYVLLRIVVYAQGFTIDPFFTYIITALYIAVVSMAIAISDRKLFPLNVISDGIFKQDFEDIMSVFSRQADVYETVRKISKILQRITTATSVEIAYRYRGDYYQVGSDNHVDIDEDHVIRQFADEILDIHTSQRLYEVVEYKKDYPELYEYCCKNDVTHILLLTIEDTIFGWITFKQSKLADDFEIQVSDFLNQMSAVLALGLRRVSLYRNVQSRVQELESINHISYVMNSSLHGGETLESVMDAVMDIIGPDRALLYILEEGGKISPLIGRGMSDDIDLNFTLDAQKSVFRYVVETKEPLIVTDVFNDDRVNKEYAQYVQTKSFAAVPLVSNEDVIGFIGVDNFYSDKSITTINIELLMSLANTAAIAIANSRLYEQSQEFNKELQRRVDEATEHLQKLIEMKSHFLKIASHQLRTPTAIIKGFLSMLIEDESLNEEERSTMINQAFMSTTRLEQIISELLSATELDDSTITPIKESIDIKELVLEIVHDLLPLAHKKDVSLKYTFPDSAYPFTSDRLKLKEILTSLVDNAIRYTPKGTVTISYTSTEAGCVISVKDTGFGISEEDKDILFNQFQRGTTIADVEPNGTGLGLFIVKRLIDILEGEITVKSEGRNKGSEFIITIPHLH